VTPTRGLATQILPGLDVSPEAVALGVAAERERRRRGVLTLDCREVLCLARSLGYRKIAPPRPVKPYGVPS